MSQEGISKVYSLTMPVRAQNTDQLLRPQYNPASKGHVSSGNKANARPTNFFFRDALKLLFRIIFCSKLTPIDNSDESFFSCKWHTSGKLRGNEVRRCAAQRYRTIYAIPAGLMVHVCFELWIYSWTIHNADFKETLLPWRSLHFLLALVLLYYPVLIFRFKYMTMPCQYLYIVDILRNFYICGTFFFSLLLIGSSIFLCLSKIDWLKITHFYVSYAVFLILMALFLLLIMRNVGISCEISFLSRQIPGETGHLCPFELVPFVENGEILLYKPTEGGWQIQRFAKEAEPKSLYSGWDRYFYPLDTARPDYPNSRITEKDHKKILCILVLLFIACLSVPIYLFIVHAFFMNYPK